MIFMNETENKKANKTTYFLLGSFLLLLLISICIFTVFGHYISKTSNESINKLGNLYMSGINEHIVNQFKILMESNLEQTESIIEVVDTNLGTTDKLYDELVYRARVRNFNYVALYSQAGELQMLNGEQISLADPLPFYTSLQQNEEKIAIGSDASGQGVVLFGINADYPMQNGETSLALVVAMPVEFIYTILGTRNDNSLVYSQIIRRDGSFIVNSINSDDSNYFNALPELYPDDDPQIIDAYIEQLSDAMKTNGTYSAVLDLGTNGVGVYCTPLPYSEWYLVSVLPAGLIDETVDTLSQNMMDATLLVCAIVLTVLIIIFYIYFRMTRQQLKELEEARQAAIAATKAKSTFLSNMSHDIRTPMNAIVGMTAIAITHIDDKNQVQNCLKKISLSGKHLLGLINDVLDMSRIENGKMTLTAERISLVEVIEGIVGIVQTQIKAKEQSFNIHIDNITVEDVYCDSVRLNQLLMNILSNAIKYTQENGTIEFTLYQEDAPEEKGSDYIRTHILIKDNGIGMSEEFLTHIFDSYSRADSKRVQKVEGAGLGMAISKWIVDAMGGTIDIKSELSKGTEFHVILDLEKATSSEIDMVLPAWKMLVVDDDESLCRTAVDTLASIGIQADWTLSGENAIQMVKKHHQTRDDYQIIMLDWKLPGIDGLSVAREIRKFVGSEMPIILISAYDWSDFEEEARAAGINGFIAKPLFRSTLFHSLKEFIDTDENSEGNTPVENPLAGHRVLVAEDNELNWEILEALLSDIGIKLERAENGKVCLEMFQNSEQGYYEAILMDVRMPIMNGYESTKAIRELSRPDAQSIPIIAMTADAFSEDVKNCLDCGMNAHTAKPVNLDELLFLLKKYILDGGSDNHNNA